MREMETEMKKVILVAAALVMASPAFAQSYNPDIGSGNIAPDPAAPTVFQRAEGAYARVVPGTSRGRAVIAPTTTAVHDEYGRVIGADPDPNIRLQLRRGADSIEW
jgi:hypothetical protein